MTEYAVINPATGETLATYPTITDDALDTVIEKADAAYHTWRDTCPFRKSYPDVLVVHPSQDRNADNGARALDCSMKRRIFL